MTFLLLESISLCLIFNPKINKKYNAAHNTPKCFHLIHKAIADLQMYSKWKTTASALLAENGDLRAHILQSHEFQNKESLLEPNIQYTWNVIPARVINNAIMHSKNYITINKGAEHGIQPGMGVMTNGGIVGKVIAVSEHYASIISLLHIDMQVSAKLASSGVLGTVCWQGNNPRKVTLLYIPRYLNITIGDKVITSGYSTTFYEGIAIGSVTKVSLEHAANFYEIEVELSTDFAALKYVYVLKNNYGKEQEDLEKKLSPCN